VLDGVYNPDGEPILSHGGDGSLKVRDARGRRKHLAQPLGGVVSQRLRSFSGRKTRRGRVGGSYAWHLGCHDRNLLRSPAWTPKTSKPGHTSRREPNSVGRIRGVIATLIPSSSWVPHSSFSFDGR
jgi:hypothetical protein